LRAAAPQQQHRPQTDGQIGQKTAAGIGHLEAAALAAGGLPHQGLDDQTTIEGQAWQQVEQGQNQVEGSQFTHHRSEGGRQVGGGMGRAQQDQSQHQAYGRAGCRHQQGATGGAAFALDTGHPTQQEQGDAAHLDPLGQGHQGMAQFVQQDRSKQQQGRQQGQAPPQRQGRGRIQILGVVLLKGQGRQNQYDEPGRMDAQRNAANPQKSPAFSHVQRCRVSRGPGAAVESRS
jgi:hypothetical protein